MNPFGGGAVSQLAQQLRSQQAQPQQPQMQRPNNFGQMIRSYVQQRQAQRPPMPTAAPQMAPAAAPMGGSPGFAALRRPTNIMAKADGGVVGSKAFDWKPNGKYK